MLIPTDVRYRQYVECADSLKRAIAHGDVEELRVLELQMRDMAGVDLDVACLAVHDVAWHLPLRSQVHLDRLLADPWRA